MIRDGGKDSNMAKERKHGWSWKMFEESHHSPFSEMYHSPNKKQIQPDWSKK